ncbi:MAG: ribosomal protein S19 family protein, partial [Prosthecobacter sp.]|nr:ribosomal protein S19 family protein [Prosthecobacter sp.]
MGRSLKKGPFVQQALLDKVDKLNDAGLKRPVKTWARSSMITP